MSPGARSARRSLLEEVQRLLERTYRMESGIDEPGRFVIGDRGLRALYGAARPGAADAIGSAGRDDGARVLVRDTADGLRACIYYPDGLIERLERRPPTRGLVDENVDDFAVLVEELDHLLVLAERARDGRRLTMFEMELHANVSKHLVLTRFLSGSDGRVDAARRRWLRFHLFDKIDFCDDDPGVRQRYRDASRWAVRLIDALPALDVERRIAALRRFHRGDTEGKVELIRRLAAGESG